MNAHNDTNGMYFLIQMHTSMLKRKLQVIFLSRAKHVGPDNVHRLLHAFNLLKPSSSYSKCNLICILNVLAPPYAIMPNNGCQSLQAVTILQFGSSLQLT
jgi:hypothetical protein